MKYNEMVPWLRWSLEEYWQINESTEKSEKPMKNIRKYFFNDIQRNGSTKKWFHGWGGAWKNTGKSKKTMKTNKSH